MNLLLLDNYDSFTWNLHHALQPHVSHIDVILNDQFNVNETTRYDAVVFSPGPGLPAEAGCMPEIINCFHNDIPMLGICLGMQAIAEAYGGSLRNLQQVLHGIPQSCQVTDPYSPLFKGLPTEFETGHYHSWVVDTVPTDFEIIAVHPNGWPMAISHKEIPLHGLQFHPESVLTPLGPEILRNWVEGIVDKQKRQTTT